MTDELPNRRNTNRTNPSTDDLEPAPQTRPPRRVRLPVLAPVVDILLVYGLLFLNRVETAVFWLAMLALQTLAAVLAFRLDREPLRPLWSLPLQQFVYRQLMYLVLIHAVISAATGIPQRWQRLHRTGQAAPADQPTPAPP